MSDSNKFPPVRFIACAATDHFATAAFKEDVGVWSFQERRLIRRFKSTFDFGGRRMALLDDLRVATAAYNVHGVSAYDQAGRRLWERRDLKRPQTLSPITLRDRIGVAIGFDETSLLVLDADDGKTIETVRAVRRAWQSDPSWLLCLQAKSISRYEIESAGTAWSISLRSFSVLDAAFSPAAVLFTEAGDAVRCVSNSGEPLWAWQPPAGSHALRVAWDRSRSVWACVTWQYAIGGPKEMVLLDGAGILLDKYVLGDFAAAAFFGDGAHVISSDGIVRTTSTGIVAWDFMQAV